MNAAHHEALTIVHAGLADVLDWLGETPVEPWEPRHAADWATIEVYRWNGDRALMETVQVPN